MTWRRPAGVFAAVVTMLLAVPALALTAARLSGSDLGPAVRLEAFAPLAIVLYAVLVLRFLVWLVRRSGRRGLPATALPLALAGLLLHLWWFSPLVLGSTPAPAAGAPVLTVMNSNLYEGRGDVIDVVDQADRAGVDVLVLEEVTAADVTQMQAAGIDDLLPYHAGGPRPNPDDDVAGTMVYSNQPLSEVQPLTTRFDGYAMRVGGSEGVGGLRLLAVHPVAPLDPGLWRRDFATITAAAVSDHPDLVVGDLNSTPDHAPLRALLDDADLTDAAQLANSGFQPTWPSNGLGPGPLPPLVSIDHVLLGRRYTAISTRTLDIPDTDHRALVAEVALRG